MSGGAAGTRILISKANIAETARDSVADTPALGDGEALFSVDRVALTANNVTYAAAGDLMGYWRFFPGTDTHGMLPVWGFGTVIESRAEGLNPGDRFYGYWPLAGRLVTEASAITDTGFFDAAPHRQGLSDFYNQYNRVPKARSAEEESIEALFRPLFMTGWLIEQFLAQNNDFGAEQIILSSASSKTALACAFCLAKRGNVAVTGLTSSSNAAFVAGLGSYGHVVTYDAVEQMEKRPSVYVDFSGDADLKARIHTHFAPELKHSATIGMTHWDKAAPGADVPPPEPQLFFAPTVAEETVKALGPAGFAKANGKAWEAFVPHARAHVAVETHTGLAAAETLYRGLADGSINGAKGYMVEP